MHWALAGIHVEHDPYGAIRQNSLRQHLPVRLPSARRDSPLASAAVSRTNATSMSAPHPGPRALAVNTSASEPTVLGSISTGADPANEQAFPGAHTRIPFRIPQGGPTDVQARSMVRKRRVSDAEGWATPTTVDPCGDSGLSAKVLSRPPASRGAAWRPALRMASQGHGSGQAVGSIGRLWNPSVSSCRQSRVRTESSCFITSASSSPSGWQVQPSRATRSTRGNGAVESRNGHPQVPICMFEHCGIAAHQKGRAESGSRAGAKKKAASELSLRRTDREPGVTCS